MALEPRFAYGVELLFRLRAGVPDVIALKARHSGTHFYIASAARNYGVCPASTPHPQGAFPGRTLGPREFSSHRLAGENLVVQDDVIGTAAAPLEKLIAVLYLSTRYRMQVTARI